MRVSERASVLNLYNDRGGRVMNRVICGVLQSYADEDHLLVGVLEHVYTSMEDFLRDCLSLDEDQGSS